MRISMTSREIDSQVPVLSKGMGRGLTTFRTLSGGVSFACCLLFVCCLMDLPLAKCPTRRKIEPRGARPDKAASVIRSPKSTTHGKELGVAKFCASLIRVKFNCFASKLSLMPLREVGAPLPPG